MPWLILNVYMKMNKYAAIDSNVLVGLLDDRDKWHVQGRLNYHDALIALACQELEIKVILSFDRDFDEVPWMERYESMSEGK